LISWADMVLAPLVAGLFKWRQFEPEVILLAVGWYLRSSMSYRDVEELLFPSYFRQSKLRSTEDGNHAGTEVIPFGSNLHCLPLPLLWTAHK
jgi:hypothetical protein